MHIYIFTHYPPPPKKSPSIKNTFYKINTSIFFSNDLLIYFIHTYICVHSQTREVHTTIINADDRY